MDGVRYTGAGCSLLALALLVHEQLTGAGYIQFVAKKLIGSYGMTQASAIGFAAALILGAPLIVSGCLLALKKR